MILEETINKLVRDITDLLLLSPGFAVKAKQKDAPRPTGAYADVTFVSDTSIGWEQKKLLNNTGDPDLTETIQGMREIMISVGFYRSGAIDNARKVRVGLIRESVQSLFSAVNIGLTRRSDIRVISEPLESGFEERSQFDIILSAVGADSDIVKSIASLNVAGELQSRNLQFNFNIEVP